MNGRFRIPVTVALILATLLTIHVLPKLASVLMLVFAGIILAVVLDQFAMLWKRVLPGGHILAYSITLTCVVVLLVIIGAVLGPHLTEQIPQLVHRVPKAWHKLLQDLDAKSLQGLVHGKASHPAQLLADKASIKKVIGGTFGVLTDVFVILFVGVYGAAAPRRYLVFCGHLLPEDAQQHVRALAHELRSALLHWILGRFLTVVIVGIATGIGLWLLGVPLAFSLGLLAGILSIVPYLGPIMGLVPAALIAAVISLPLAGWVVILFAGVHLAEAALLIPLIQQRAISMPPAVLITSQLVGGILFGLLGVFLAAPMVVCYVVVVRWRRGQGSLIMDSAQ